MNPEVNRLIEELRGEIKTLRSDVESYKANTSRDVAALNFGQDTHTHGGTDSSTMIYNDSIHLKPGQQFATGNFAIAEQTGSPQPGQDSVMRGFLIMGDDLNAQDGIQNAQITFEHQPSTNGSTNQTFLYAFRSPLYIGNDGTVASAGTTLTTDQYAFETDALIGAYAQVTNPSDGTFEAYLITANTKDTITIDGAWGFAAANAFYVIFVPVYLGSADFPWRRVYVTTGEGGGIRFGVGDTGGGQNGLLYMDTAGDIFWRDLAGSSTQINGGSSAYTSLGTEDVVTISGGTATGTTGYIELDTEGAAASDDLDTLTLTGAGVGTLAVLRPTSSARTIVVTEAGNIRLESAGSFTMDHNRDTITLIRGNASTWYEVSRSNNDT